MAAGERSNLSHNYGIIDCTSTVGLQRFFPLDPFFSNIWNTQWSFIKGKDERCDRKLQLNSTDANYLDLDSNLAKSSEVLGIYVQTSRDDLVFKEPRRRLQLRFMISNVDQDMFSNSPGGAPRPLRHVLAQRPATS